MPDRSATLIALNTLPTLNRASLCRLGQDPEAWMIPPPQGSEAQVEEARRLGVPPACLAQARALIRRAEDLAEGEIRRVEALGARIVTRHQEAYPASLLDLELPPPVLYVLGELPPEPAVALVGSRRATAYGRQAAAFFASTLAAAGIAVASGFARGIDAEAHEGALAVPAGRTIAVLGCGLDVAYPSQHGQLREKIRQQGALITEFPLGLEPRPWHFPVRNRVIAALSAATMVIEAAPRSGSLITAHHALELGREIYALPGSVFDASSRGPHGLIRDGATLVESPEQILESLKPARRLPLELSPPVAPPPRPLPKGLNGKLLDRLPPGEARSPDELAEATGLPMHQLLAALLDLELAGWIRRLPGPAYRRSLASREP
jgi:DNA processing protein